MGVKSRNAHGPEFSTHFGDLRLSYNLLVFFQTNDRRILQIRILNVGIERTVLNRRVPLEAEVFVNFNIGKASQLRMRQEHRLR